MARKTHTEAQARYDKVNRRVYGFRLHNDIDSDIIAKLASVDSMQGYIKQLIREDLNRTYSGSVPVPLSPAALETLKEKAAQTGISVPDLIKNIVNECIMRDMRKQIGSAPESVPKTERE